MRQGGFYIEFEFWIISGFKKNKLDSENEFRNI